MIDVCVFCSYCILYIYIFLYIYVCLCVHIRVSFCFSRTRRRILNNDDHYTGKYSGTRPPIQVTELKCQLEFRSLSIKGLKAHLSARLLKSLSQEEETEMKNKASVDADIHAEEEMLVGDTTIKVDADDDDIDDDVKPDDEVVVVVVNSDAKTAEGSPKAKTDKSGKPKEPVKPKVDLLPLSLLVQTAYTESLKFLDSTNDSILYSPSLYIYEHTQSPYTPNNTPIHEPHTFFSIMFLSFQSNM